MNTSKAVAGLRRLVKRLVADGATDKDSYREWKRNEANERFMARCLAYTRGDGMPAATALIQPFFHPDHPLIGLNYGDVAHVTLHQYGDAGWTPPMRLCRGIVFDHDGKVVAFPFPKFFNYGEHLETKTFPNEAWVATAKQDGHLGIIFEYNGDLIVTTRGWFLSKTSIIAKDMLAEYKERWLKVLPKSVTLLAEIIHPETEVLTDYAGWTGFVLIGAFNRRTYKDFAYPELSALADKLGIRVTPKWEGKSLKDLIALMQDPTVANQEGFVVRFDSGLRIKFKFATYIARMIGEKLNARYVMRRIMDGTLDKRVGNLPGEVEQEAARLKEAVMGVKNVEGGRKARWEYLYGLEPNADEFEAHKAVCHTFQAWLVRTGEMPKAK